MVADSTEPVAFVAVPFPAQGHLNQLLHLSLLVASRGLSVHYVAPAAHVRQARSRLHGWDPDDLSSIHFHDLDVSTYESPAPDPTAPFPNHLLPMWETFDAAARAPLAALLDSLSATHRRVVVVYDIMNTFAAVEAARLGNGEAYGLMCVAISCHLGWLDAGHQLLRKNGGQYVPMEVSSSKEFMEYMFRRTAELQVAGGPGAASAVGLVMNTCRELEGEFIDATAEHPIYKDKKLFAVGPLNPLLDASARTPGKTRHKCMDWLDAQPPASVLYVSFGTTSSFRGEQIAEMAAALKGSKQRFIWVLRDADRADIFTESGVMQQAKLMSEFTKDIKGTGLVITGWAPQLEILAHGSTAAFMSHCGWNSTLESLSHGKPILAWPMHSDQLWDAELLCKFLKAGLLVRPWEKHDQVVPAEAIQEVIEKAMLSENGMAMRQRAKELGEAVRASMAEGGSSSTHMDEFVAYITR
ncbi:putative cis-zeatin O-glucosyltransferase [Lolium rigidum]|uniref:putative cis-zeatin O-glucosyltransferase n=1 Tax=Lolium rigidum TaxID=89674 RepID=UPI001F5CB5CD|nr:putative cis-zeatin O-glucosyltransferase [Lolium rigidum]